MPKIVPIEKLNEYDLSELCREHKEVFLTKEGFGNLVAVSIERYNELTENKRKDEDWEEIHNAYI